MNAVFSTGPCPALGLFLALNQFPLPSRPPPSALTFHGAVVEVCAAGLAGPQDELPPRALLGAICIVWMLASCRGGRRRRRRRRCASTRMRASGGGSEGFSFGFLGDLGVGSFLPTSFHLSPPSCSPVSVPFPLSPNRSRPRLFSEVVVMDVDSALTRRWMREGRRPSRRSLGPAPQAGVFGE